MSREIVYFCAELLNYWSMTFFGLKLFAKVYEFSVHKNKNVENVIYAMSCLPISLFAAGNYFYSLYSISLTYIIILYMYIIGKILSKEKLDFSFISLYVFVMRLLDLWIVAVIEETNKMSRHIYVELIHSGIKRIIYMIILSISYYAFYCIFFKMDFINYLFSNKLNCKILCLYSFLGNSCFNGVYRFEYREQLIGYWTFYLVVAFMFIGIFLVWFIKTRGKEREKLLNMRNNLMEINYISLKKAYTENITLQHDYKNHLLAVLELIKNNKSTDAENYIYSFLNQTNRSLININSGNDILDIILSCKISEANEKRIRFFHQVECINDFYIENIDMCALMANLLDNSIEACEKIETDNSWIDLKIIKRKDMVLIQLCNSIQQEKIKKGNFFVTEKKNTQLHGWGMKSIENVVKKYEGIKSYHIEDNRIECFITLPIR